MLLMCQSRLQNTLHPLLQLAVLNPFITVRSPQALLIDSGCPPGTAARSLSPIEQTEPEGRTAGPAAAASVGAGATCQSPGARDTRLHGEATLRARVRAGAGQAEPSDPDGPDLT